MHVLVTCTTTAQNATATSADIHRLGIAAVVVVAVAVVGVVLLVLVLLVLLVKGEALMLRAPRLLVAPTAPPMMNKVAVAVVGALTFG